MTNPVRMTDDELHAMWDVVTRQRVELYGQRPNDRAVGVRLSEIADECRALEREIDYRRFRHTISGQAK